MSAVNLQGLGQGSLQMAGLRIARDSGAQDRNRARGIAGGAANARGLGIHHRMRERLGQQRQCGLCALEVARQQQCLGVTVARRDFAGIGLVGQL